MPTGTGEPQAIAVPMSDGVALAAIRFPAPTSPAPAVVMLTPYRKEPFAATMARFGILDIACEIVIADVRGIGGSGGDWDGPLSPREVRDGAELVEWVARQDFCDGRTALVGSSYMAQNTLLVAARRPRGLRCAVAVVPPVDVYRDMWHRGGIPSHTNWGAGVAFNNQHRPDAQRRVLEDFYMRTVGDPFDGQRPRMRSAEHVLHEIDVPVLIVGGWYDYFVRGALRAFRLLRSAKRLVIGNWGHGGDGEGGVVKGESARWLGHWLRGGADPSSDGNVRLQSVGSGAWRSHDGWPPADGIAFERWHPVAVPTPIDLAPCLEIPPAFRSPVPVMEDIGTGSGMHIWREAWTAETAAADAITAFRGPVALKAVLVSDAATDLDLHARVSIVRTDGTVDQVTEGRLRASHRAVDMERSELSADGDVAVPWHPHDHAEPLPIGEPATLVVEILPVSIELAPGERLRLGISLTRRDDVVAPARVTLCPETHLLLPRK